MPGFRCLLLLIPLSVISTAGVPARADQPARLWVAPLHGEASTTAIRDAGAVIRDRYPDAVVLDDPRSVEALRAAGLRVDGPFVVPDAAAVFLLRSRGGSGGAEPAEPSALAGVEILWSNGTSSLVRADDGLPAALPAHLSGKVLATHPIGSLPAFEPGDTATSRATTFDPLVDEVVGLVDSTAYFPWIRRLSGADPVIVGGQPVTFSTRYSSSPECRTAEQYVYEQFQSMGFTDVAYQTFNIGSGGPEARNVIATLPGETTPERIYILCGHLDSTSPSALLNAPGANDNASGTAAVLAGASILSNYSFDSTIQFIAFTGEEQGLYGSQIHAYMAELNGDDIRGVVNCDMIAYYNTHYRIDIEGESFADPLMQVMDDACAAYTGLNTSLLYFAWGSDHVPYLNRGFPAFLAIESDYGSYPCYHATCDTHDQNDAGFGVEVTRACLATIAHLAGIQPGTTGVAVTGGSIGDVAIHPNPFRDVTDVRFSLARAGLVRLTIHDVGGRLVRTLVSEPRTPGTHRSPWDGRTDLGVPTPAGIYFVRLESDGAAASGRLVRIP